MLSMFLRISTAPEKECSDDLGDAEHYIIILNAVGMQLWEVQAFKQIALNIIIQLLTSMPLNIM